MEDSGSEGPGRSETGSAESPTIAGIRAAFAPGVKICASIVTDSNGEETVRYSYDCGECNSLASMCRHELSWSWSWDSLRRVFSNPRGWTCVLYFNERSSQPCQCEFDSCPML
jgi:hypothetical protein